MCVGPLSDFLLFGCDALIVLFKRIPCGDVVLDGGQQHLEAQHHAEHCNHDCAGGGGGLHSCVMYPFAESENNAEQKERPAEKDVHRIDVEVTDKIAQDYSACKGFGQFSRK